MAVVLMASFLRVGNGQFVWMPYRCIGYVEIYIYHVVMYVSQCKNHFTSKVDLEICVHYANSSSNVYSLRNDHHNQGVFLKQSGFYYQ